jgi:hypothetical protein
VGEALDSTRSDSVGRLDDARLLCVGAGRHLGRDDRSPGDEDGVREGSADVDPENRAGLVGDQCGASSSNATRPAP